jgi:hypothetical protein
LAGLERSKWIKKYDRAELFDEIITDAKGNMLHNIEI